MLEQEKRSAGRPRRLTLEAIVDAACAIGLDDIEMCQVAEQLGTPVATLYGYVRGREELLDMVAQRLAEQSLVPDRGQSWQDIVREQAAITFKLFRSKPQLIMSLMGNDLEVRADDCTRRLIGMFVDRGFSQESAINLIIESNQAVVGAAIGAIKRDSSRAGPEDPIWRYTALGNYHPTIERIILGYEQDMMAAV